MQASSSGVLGITGSDTVEREPLTAAPLPTAGGLLTQQAPRLWDKISIVVVDDHLLIRQGVRALLVSETDLQVVGEAADGETALELVERVYPELLVLDLSMQGVGGLETARRLRQNHPSVKILVVSMHHEEEYVINAFRCGVRGYLLKEESGDSLAEAIRLVAAGGRYLSPSLLKPAVAGGINRTLAPAEALPSDPLETLTPRERQVMELAVTGHTNKEIADQLTISVRTVEVHRFNMMHKLEVRTVAELASWALRRGILSHA